MCNNENWKLPKYQQHGKIKYIKVYDYYEAFKISLLKVFTK